jgi:MerR family transcriptional regulator, light-induced transcriptional regulator
MCCIEIIIDINYTYNSAEDMEALYTIGAAARQTGLSVHVLRAWERRYGVVEPVRAEGGGRLYTEEDVGRLQLLGRLAERGHGIGRIAKLSSDELRGLLASAPTEGLGEASAGIAAFVEEEEALLSAVEALLAMDGERMRGTLMRAALKLRSRDFVDRVMVPLLRQAGDLWSGERICPAHEHVLSVEVSRVLGWLAASIPVPAGARSAIAATPVGQRHEFGAYLASIVAGEEGWRVTYLGPDLPASDIGTAYKMKGAEVALISVVHEQRFGAIQAELKELRKAIGRGGRILVGGAGVAGRGVEIERAGGTLVEDLDALRTALRRQEGE